MIHYPASTNTLPKDLELVLQANSTSKFRGEHGELYQFIAPLIKNGGRDPSLNKIFLLNPSAGATVELLDAFPKEAAIESVALSVINQTFATTLLPLEQSFQKFLVVDRKATKGNILRHNLSQTKFCRKYYAIEKIWHSLWESLSLTQSSKHMPLCLSRHQYGVCVAVRSS
jgi:hypothetical protein